MQRKLGLGSIDKVQAQRLTVALLITLGLTVWYDISGSSVAIRIVGAVWFFTLLGWFFKKIGYMKKVDEAFEKVMKK